MLMLDGGVQITKRDEFIYQEMMAQVPLFAHGNARDVLIIGGGDCGIAEEALKHKTLQRLVQVEIDASVIEFAKPHFPEFTKPALADARFNSIIDHGMRSVAASERRFDVIIVDSTDPQGPGKILFSRKFYAACRRCLNTGGVLVTQDGVPFFQPRELRTSIGTLRPLVRRRHLLCRRSADLCRRPSGHGLGQRRQKFEANTRKDPRCASSTSRRLRHEILHARGSGRRVRAAALHCRCGCQSRATLTLCPSAFD
jgi:hypothetical protein